MPILETGNRLKNSEVHQDNVEGDRFHQQSSVLHQFINDVLGYILESRFGRNENRELIATCNFKYWIL